MADRLTAELAAQQEESELYTTLYHVVASAAVDNEWETGYLQFRIVAPDVWNYKSATLKDGEPRFKFPEALPLSDAQVVFLELARRMKVAGHPEWNIARFETTRAGKTKLHFSYQDED